MKLCDKQQVKNIVEQFLADMYGASYFSLNCENEDKLNDLFDYYSTEFENIVEN